MTLKERITEDMKGAMRAGEKERLGTIRLALAAIKQREVDERITLDDGQVLAVLEKMIKQRREAITQFESGGRAGKPVSVRRFNTQFDGAANGSDRYGPWSPSNQ